MNDIPVIMLAFEAWILSAIPDFDETLLVGFHHEDGYIKSETVNSMWVGFCAAHRLLSK
mgnify:CR=1 FL=1